MEKHSLTGPQDYAPRPIFLPHTESSSADLLATSAAVLPEQFYHSPAQTAGRGEVALMRAVLEEALDCFQKQFVKSGRRAQRLAREAEEWLFSDEASWPFSFVNICAVLGIEPGYIRLKLKRWSENAQLRAKELDSESSAPSAFGSWRGSRSFPSLRPSGA